MNELPILVIDDDPAVHNIIDFFLDGEPYTLLHALHPEEGLRMAADHSPGLILLDIDMPQMTGLDLCDQLTQAEATQGIPIIFLTRMSGAAYTVEGFSRGGVDYITKPFEGPELKARVDACLRTRQAAAQLTETVSQLTEWHSDLTAILNELHVGTMLIDEQDRILFLNREGERLLGIRAPFDLSATWKELLPVSHTQIAAIQAACSLPPARRSRIPASSQGGKAAYHMDIEVKTDPRNPRRKLLIFYDTTEVNVLRRMLDGKTAFQDLIGHSEPMRRVTERIQQLCRVDTTVLIEGETGTGKELVARALHYASPRKDKPFIALNCAGLAESTLYSQLFGHKRGSFTGAIEDNCGVFEAADGGTVFLDEIAGISPGVQSSLLRVLEAREIIRLGETKARSIDVRVLAATNRDLVQECRDGNFRPDLLYRVRVARIQLPLLADRRDDIPLLTSHFLRQFTAVIGKPVESISLDAMDALVNYAWPGNIRELRNTIEHAVIHCPSSVILPGDLPPEITLETIPAEQPLARIDDEQERIQAALDRSGGNRSAAARLLGIHRATLYRRLAELSGEQSVS